MDPSMNAHSFSNSPGATDYENALFGESLKQADVTLMGYLLQYDMPAQVRLNDLLYEVAYTNVSEPTPSSPSPSSSWARTTLVTPRRSSGRSTIST
jgi:hypothetical protein